MEPSDEDKRWWSEQNDEWHDDQPPDDDIEHRAAESAWMDAYELGLKTF